MSKATYLIVYDDNVQVHSSATESAAMGLVKKKNGHILHVFYNVEDQQLEVREVFPEKNTEPEQVSS